jgi:hypothetical protein
MAPKFQKIHGLDFSSHIRIFSEGFSRELSLLYSTAASHSAYSDFACRAGVLNGCIHDFRARLVDRLEGEIRGENMGDCSKLGIHYGVRQAIHSSPTTCLGLGTELAVDWDRRTTDFLPVGSATAQLLKELMRPA